MHLAVVLTLRAKISEKKRIFSDTVFIRLSTATLRARLVATGVGVTLTCLLLLLVTIGLVTWTLHRRRHSGRYPVHEKERLHGASAGVNLYDEPPFGEYVRT